jgi:hypothetical protein
MNSQISQTIYPGNESQGIWMAQSQTIKIVHNWIEGTSENIFCGGDAEYIPGLQSCNDLEVRRNRLTYPGAWLGTTKWPGTAQSMARKNCTEFKSANRVLQDGNICENVDDSGGQLRPFGLNPKAYNGVVPQYWTVISNITWTNNILRHVCNQGAWFGERSSPSPNGQGVSLPLQRLNLSNNLAYDISKPSFCSAADNVGMGMQWNSSDTQFTGCSGARDDRGKVVTLTCVNNGTGMAQTDTAVGDPVTVSGCTDSSFNAGGAVLGPPALPGTNGLIVVYANRGAANATTNGCVFDNFQGYPKYSIYSHNTLIELPASPGGFYVSLTHGKRVGFAFMQFNTVRDNIITAGGVQGQGLGDTGNQTSQSVNWDLTTSQWHHNIYVGRGCSDYVDVLTSGGKQKSPPATSFCPANAFCSGQDPGARSCVGFTGAMGTTSLNVNLSDWNGYGLCHDGKLGCSKASLYAAGEKRQASDRMDVGASMPAIGTAETRTKYECRGSCGPGPFSD